MLGKESNTPTGRTNLRIALDAGLRELETRDVIYNHSIDKLEVFAGAGPRDVIARYTALQIAGTMDILTFELKITW